VLTALSSIWEELYRVQIVLFPLGRVSWTIVKGGHLKKHNTSQQWGASLYKTTTQTNNCEQLCILETKVRNAH